MKKLTHSEILSIRLTPEQSLNAKRHPFSLMLYNIRSLYNVGSIFRTCDAALAAKLILTGFTPHPPRVEIEKTALGAVDTVPWYYDKSIQNAIQNERNNGNKIIALEITDNHKSYLELDKNNFPCCFVLGNELTGIDNEILELCDDSVEIPMYGVKHSLNVSVAAGILLFESVRKWESIIKKTK